MAGRSGVPKAVLKNLGGGLARHTRHTSGHQHWMSLHGQEF